MFSALRAAARQAPLYIRDATDIFVLLAVPDKVRLRSAGEQPIAAPAKPVTRAARRSAA